MSASHKKVQVESSVSIAELVKYREPLKRFFLRRLRNPSEAEDMAQEVLTRMVRRCADLPPEHLEGFLFISAANLVRDIARRRKIENGAFSEISSAHQISHEEISPERIVRSRQCLEAVLGALDELDERVKHAFILNRIRGMKYAEIANLLGMSASSIEKYVIKAHAHLAMKNIWP